MTSIKDFTCSHGTRLTKFCRECGVTSIMREHKAIYTGVDMVDHPPHYKVGGIETIDYIQAKLTDEEFSGYCKGNALKYISRANHKKDATEDLRKAIWYLNRLITPEGK